MELRKHPTPVTTNATGTAWAVLSADLSSLSYQVTYAQLDSNFTASHFHIGAAGSSGGVIFPITTFSGNTASGSWDNIPDSIVAKLIKGELYINVHSIAHPGGEIRGQLYPVSGIGFTVSLDGNQVTPTPVTTNASGTGWVVLDNNGAEINHSLTVAGLSSNLTAAHFHNAPIGTSGGVVHPIAFSDSTSTGSWTGFADNMISELLKNNLYLNVHTVNFPAGEIRGQVILRSDIMLNASLDGNQEAPTPVTTNATGTAWAVLSADLSSLSYQVTYAQLDSNFTASHFHIGAAGLQAGLSSLSLLLAEILLPALGIIFPILLLLSCSKVNFILMFIPLLILAVKSAANFIRLAVLDSQFLSTVIKLLLLRLLLMLPVPAGLCLIIMELK